MATGIPGDGLEAEELGRRIAVLAPEVTWGTMSRVLGVPTLVGTTPQETVQITAYRLASIDLSFVRQTVEATNLLLESVDRGTLRQTFVVFLAAAEILDQEDILKLLGSFNRIQWSKAGPDEPRALISVMASEGGSPVAPGAKEAWPDLTNLDLAGASPQPSEPVPAPAEDFGIATPAFGSVAPPPGIRPPSAEPHPGLSPPSAPPPPPDFTDFEDPDVLEPTTPEADSPAIPVPKFGSLPPPPGLVHPEGVPSPPSSSPGQLQLEPGRPLSVPGATFSAPPGRPTSSAGARPRPPGSRPASSSFPRPRPPGADPTASSPGSMVRPVSTPGGPPPAYRGATGVPPPPAFQGSAGVPPPPPPPAPNPPPRETDEDATLSEVLHAPGDPSYASEVPDSGDVEGPTISDVLRAPTPSEVSGVSGETASKALSGALEASQVVAPQPEEAAPVATVRPTSSPRVRRSRASTPTPRPASDGGAIDVLVVDDDPLIREMIPEILRGLGLEVATASDYAEFRQEAFSRPVGVVLLDVHLPGMEGDKAARMLRLARPPRPQVLLYSAIDEDELAARAAAAGVRGYIRKGCRQRELVEAVQEALVEHRRGGR